MKRLLVPVAICAAGVFGPISSAAAHAHRSTTHHRAHVNHVAAVRPAISDWQFLSADGTPPSQAACNAVGRRCFDPAAMAGSYDYATLHAAGNEGQGKTIAIVDSFGASTIRQDLATFDKAFGLPDPCGVTGPSSPAGNCGATTSPRFDIVCFQGCPSPTPPNNSNNGTGQENRNLWSIEVALDVEWAHATAPLANILLVTTPTAETLGVQGLQQMMHAERYVIDNHMADVITQSFGTAEGAFHNGLAAISQLRQTFVDAQANDISVFASTGDFGTANTLKEPVKNPATIPYPSVIWPASDPLVTAVGGTYLCTDAVTGTTVDSVSPPVNCQSNPGVREIGWVAGGGGYSELFSRPDYQDVLPPGSVFAGTSVGAPGPNTNMRGLPDIAYQASSRTGVLVYLTEPQGAASNGTGCGGASPCSSGWYVVGGTSSGSPQWAGLAAMADQMAGHDLGFLNPKLYAVAADPAKYAADFYDVTTGCNDPDPTNPPPGYCAGPGWDAVTGLGTPDAAKLIPDLISQP
jgi:subtilase family serine protease